jgi:hypothetical protein
VSAAPSSLEDTTYETIDDDTGVVPAKTAPDAKGTVEVAACQVFGAHRVCCFIISTRPRYFSDE